MWDLPAQNTPILLHTEANDQFILDIAVHFASLFVRYVTTIVDAVPMQAQLSTRNFLL